MLRKKSARSFAKKLKAGPAAAATPSDSRALEYVLAMKVGSPFTAQFGGVGIKGVIQRMDLETVTIKLSSRRGDAYLIVETLMLDHTDGRWSVRL